jgi:hypothetical protein
MACTLGVEGWGRASRWKRLRVLPKSTRVSTCVEQVEVEQKSVGIALIQRASEGVHDSVLDASP